MESPGNQTEFFYTEKGLIAIDSPVKLQILNLLKEDSSSFDAIVRHTAKAKSTISVHLNKLRALGLVAEELDPLDRLRKTYFLTSYYMGRSRKPRLENYKKVLKRMDSARIHEPIFFMDVLFHAFCFGCEAYGLDNAPIIKKIGNDIGKKLASEFRAKELEGLLGEIASFFELHEKISLVKKDPLSLVVRDSFKEDSRISSGKTLCAFEEGLIEGLLYGKLGKKFRVKETECYGTGHGHCLFSISK
ncbi:MAG: ArsR family transcriptional regulator [Methanosarcinaceae archaeon]|nr:ArsR family transcriptional regulator [Methanosarcinaceae archaeon]